MDELGQVFRLGNKELAILALLNEYGHTYWMLVERICGCRKSECQKDKRKESCRISVSHALKSLRRKELVYKKRYQGEVRYYLTKAGRKLTGMFLPK